MATAWPWLALAGLGLYHGLNPAMGWLFAAALGLHRGRRAAVLQAIGAIALGHVAAVAAVAAAVVMLGLAVDAAALRTAAGLVLIGFAAWHGLSGTRHRVRVGMQAGFAGLVLWSFVMAAAHGAGLMLVPALLPLCLPDGAVPDGPGLTVMALAGVAVHSAALLAATATAALATYEWIGVDFLRRGWINLDRLWTAALAATGALLLAM
jgi:hypothetical protein